MPTLQDTYRATNGSRINRSASPALLVKVLASPTGTVHIFTLYRVNETTGWKTVGHSYTDLQALEADASCYVPGYDPEAWEAHDGSTG